MSRLQIAANAGTAISAVVGVAALVVTLLSIQTRAEAERVRQWQEVAVFSIIERHVPSSVSFQEITEEYVSEVKAFQAVNVPDKPMKETTLKRILLRLLSQGIIEVDSEGRYAVASLATTASVRGAAEPRDPAAEILDAVRLRSCQLSHDQVIELVQSKVSATYSERSGIMESLVTRGLVAFDANQRLCTAGQR